MSSVARCCVKCSPVMSGHARYTSRSLKDLITSLVSSSLQCIFLWWKSNGDLCPFLLLLLTEWNKWLGVLSILQGRVFCVSASLSLGNVSRRYRSLLLLQTLDLSLLVQLACDQPLLNILLVAAYLCIIQSFNLMTTINSHLNVAIWVRGWFGLIMLMFLCTWRPQGSCSSHSYFTYAHYFMKNFDYLVSSGWASPRIVGLVCVIT